MKTQAEIDKEIDEIRAEVKHDVKVWQEYHERRHEEKVNSFLYSVIFLLCGILAVGGLTLVLISVYRFFIRVL